MLVWDCLNSQARKRTDSADRRWR